MDFKTDFKESKKMIETTKFRITDDAIEHILKIMMAKELGCFEDEIQLTEYSRQGCFFGYEVKIVREISL